MSFKTKISVDNTGTCYWLSPIDFLASCAFHIGNFPFDSQDCKVKFGPWTDDIKKVHLNTNDVPVVTSQYTENVEWSLEEASQQIVTSYYHCCPTPFRDLVIKLRLQRKPTFYIVNSIVPCLFLFILIILGHRLPPQCGERITLTIMICLTCIVMMEYTNSRILPQTSEISSLGKVFLTITTVSSLSILETCYVLALYHRPEGMLKWLPRRLMRMIVQEKEVETRNHAMERHPEQGRYQLKRPSFNRYDQNTSKKVSTVKLEEMEDSPELEKAKLIFEEIKNYNRESNIDDNSKVFTQNAKQVGKFLDNTFILAAVISVLVALLVEIL